MFFGNWVDYLMIKFIIPLVVAGWLIYEAWLLLCEYWYIVVGFIVVVCILGGICAAMAGDTEGSEESAEGDDSKIQ